MRQLLSSFVVAWCNLYQKWTDSDLLILAMGRKLPKMWFSLHFFQKNQHLYNMNEMVFNRYTVSCQEYFVLLAYFEELCLKWIFLIAIIVFHSHNYISQIYLNIWVSFCFCLIEANTEFIMGFRTTMVRMSLNSIKCVILTLKLPIILLFCDMQADNRY